MHIQIQMLSALHYLEWLGILAVAISSVLLRRIKFTSVNLLLPIQEVKIRHIVSHSHTYGVGSCCHQHYEMRCGDLQGSTEKHHIPLWEIWCIYPFTDHIKTTCTVVP